MKFRKEESAELKERLQKLTRQFGEIASNTMNSLIGSDFEVKEVTYTSEGVDTKKTLLFTIGFNGSVLGEFIFAMNPDTLKSVVKGNDEDMPGEILNVVSGQLLLELSKVYRRLTITSPRMIRGQILYPRARSARAVIRGFHGEIECHIFLDQMQLEMASAYDEAISTLNELLKLGEQIVRKASKNAETIRLEFGVARELSFL